MEHHNLYERTKDAVLTQDNNRIHHHETRALVIHGLGKAGRTHDHSLLQGQSLAAHGCAKGVGDIVSTCTHRRQRVSNLQLDASGPNRWPLRLYQSKQHC